MKLAPVVLFTYNRLDYLKQTIEHLKENVYANESSLYIFSDGPKDEKDELKVKEVRKYLKSICYFKELHIIERQYNIGLAENVIDGVTTIVNLFDKVIVLEDDLITSRYFLKFMNEALDFYADIPKVMCISGYNCPIEIEGLPELFFVQDGQTWGWATWKRAWSLYERNPEKLIKTFTKSMIKRFDFNNSGQYWYQVVKNYEGTLKSWGIFWSATIFLNDGLTLFPRESFVNHIGKKGTNFGNVNFYDVKISEKQSWTFPTQIEENCIARKRIEKFLHSVKSPWWIRLLKSLIPINVKKTKILKIFNTKLLFL
ncbi:MAG: glycosyltransferase [Bacteroidales bacterium]|nr:glycosyltransferase [Bacteroidales bacterium]